MAHLAPVVPHLIEGAPRLLVCGGTGAVGAGIVERASDLALPVTCVGRRPEPAPRLRDALLAKRNVPYQGLDVFDPEAEPRLRSLLDAHDWIVVCCEPWSGDDAEALRGVDGMRRIYRIARETGFTVEANRPRKLRGQARRRIVRIGSSAAELPLDLLGEDAGPPWPEERIRQEDVEAVAAGDPCWDNAYFGSKVLQARNARDAIAEGLDLVTVLPTYVVSWWGDYGGEEPLLRLMRTAESTGFLPRTPFNAIPVDAAATGILLAAAVGETGARYQLTGVDTDTFAVHVASMRASARRLRGGGREPLPLPLPRFELIDELRLLRGERRGAPWLDLWLLPWDAWRRSLLQGYRIEPWHLALLAQGGHRSGRRLRALARGLPPRLAPLRLPDPEDLRDALDEAARRKMEWLENAPCDPEAAGSAQARSRAAS